MPNRTKVLIVGGSLGGLVLAILLERAGIEYWVLEQSVLVRPIGSVIALSPLVLPLMEQLGLLEEIKRLSKPVAGLTFLRDDLSTIGRIVFNDNNRGMDHQKRYGSYDQTLPHPDLYNLLLTHIPPERVKRGKRLVNFKQTETEVTVRCSDGTFYAAEILVGADGAASTVRTSLYRQMKDVKLLPRADMEPEKYKHVCLIGVTNPLSLKRYPDLGLRFSTFKIVLNRNSPYMCWFIPIPGHRCAWLVSRALDESVVVNSGNSDSSEWGREAIEEMSKSVRHLICPAGGTVGELIDCTPREVMAKVMLEDRHFKTWFHGRTVLLGDACHRSAPFTGKGANESILDAAVLASLIYDMPSSNQQEIHMLLKKYAQTRSPITKKVVDQSGKVGALLVNRSWTGSLLRTLIFSLQNTWKYRTEVDKMHLHRYQASFLPFVPDRGAIPRLPQTPSANVIHKDWKKEQERKEQQRQSVLGTILDFPAVAL
ncbi:hypothetical protein CPC16_011848 [Podila verticillata]|nr:hypothetical protein CPC16_011848 [Podila verticillata]KAI9233816.1 MAG: hypothetical protein BYD32DRAFT_424942 [Podila humilis]